jgi:hypothetical protein
VSSIPSKKEKLKAKPNKFFKTNKNLLFDIYFTYKDHIVLASYMSAQSRKSCYQDREAGQFL